MPIAVSATLAVNEAITLRRRQGLPVLPMGFGEAGLPVHPVMRDALSTGGDQNGYGPVAGLRELREAAAGYWERRGLSTDPDLVVAGPGSKPLLYALVLAIGGDIAVAAPSWVSYAAQTQLAGGRPLLVPTLPAQGGVPDPELLARAVAEARAAGRQVRAVITTCPDNPTGTVASRDTVRRLAEAARDLDLVVISDEIYRDLVHDPATVVHSPAEFAPERTVVTTGLSKNLALGGWRIGVARLPDGAEDLRRRLLAVASEIWSAPSAPVQEAAAYAFTDPPELTERIERSRALHGAVARAVRERFLAVGASVPAPHGGFYLYPDLSHLGLGGSAEVTRRLLDGHGIGVLPGHAFGDDPAAARVRVAVSLLYGETTEERTAALDSDDPLRLPWISASLDHLSLGLTAMSLDLSEPSPALAS